MVFLNKLWHWPYYFGRDSIRSDKCMVPINEETKKENESATYRHPNYTGNLATYKDGMGDHLKTVQDIILYDREKRAGWDAWGERLVNPETKKRDDHFTWASFGECIYEGQKIGSAIMKLNLAPETAECNKLDIKNRTILNECHKMKALAFFTNSSKELYLFDCACALFGFTMIPIPDTADKETSAFMINQSDVSTVFTNTKNITKVIESIQENKLPKLQNLA